MDDLIEFRPLRVDDFVIVHNDVGLTYGRIVDTGHGYHARVEVNPGVTVWVPKQLITLDLDKMKPVLYDDLIKTRRPQRMRLNTRS